MSHLVSPTMLRFLAVGGLAFVVNQAVLLALYEVIFATLRDAHAGAALFLASTIALETSILLRFPLNDRWTFRGRCRKPLIERFVQFHVSSFASPLICLAAVNLLPPFLGINYLIANSLGVAVGLAWNWLWSNRVVWNETAGDAGMEPARLLPRQEVRNLERRKGDRTMKTVDVVLPS